MQKLRLLWR